MFSKKMKELIIALAIVLFWLASCALASIDSVDIDITTGGYLFNDDSTEARILLRFDLPQDISGAELFFAELFIPVTSHIPDSSALRILLYPLVIPWDENTTWHDLGDSLTEDVISNQGTHYATSQEGQRLAYFDITPIITAWRVGRIANNGLILFCSSDELPYFRYRRNQDSPFARVKIYFDH